VTAMNIMGFDGTNHPKEVLGEILAGGQSKIAECGGVIAGGHTIETPEMLYGLSVSGFIHPKRIYRNNTPREGDVLLLTKPLGMGVLTTAIKADKLERSAISRVAAILAQLNQKASLTMRQFDVSACTDITGFGLAGHAYEMSGGRYTMQFDYDALPFVPEALPLARECIVPGGSYANQAYLEPMTAFEAEQGDDILFYDAQTSGGLLMAVSEADVCTLQQQLIAEGYEHTAIIGKVLSLRDKALIVS